MAAKTDMGKTLLLIRSHFNGLTKTEKKVATHILECASDIIYQSVTELAEKAEVSETTVLRLCRKLKFHGFQDFKLALAQDQVQVQPSGYLHTEVNEQDDALTLAHKIIASNMQTMEQTRDLAHIGQLTKAIELLVEADSVQFFGVGSSGMTAVQAANIFMRIGKRCGSSIDTHFQAMEASLMSPGSVAVGISISGSTKDTIDNLSLAKKAGAKIIVITSNARSPITKQADTVLLTVAKESPLQGSSLAAQISQLCMIDILNAGVSLRMKGEALKYRERTAKAISDKLL